MLELGIANAIKDAQHAAWNPDHTYPLSAQTHAVVHDTFTAAQQDAGYSYGCTHTVEVTYSRQGWKALYGVLPDGSVTLWAN